jgi:hypothetical protein
VELAVDNVAATILVHEDVEIAGGVTSVDELGLELEGPGWRLCCRRAVSCILPLLIDIIPEKDVELGTRIVHHVRSVEDAAVGELLALHCLADEFPTARAQILGFPDRYVVVRLETAAGTSCRPCHVAAGFGRVCTFAIFCCVHPPGAIDVPDCTIMRVHNLTRCR